ncbi:MAG: TAXI family TRAP transporter solute-binding subunit [Desulfobacterales bacterium]
MASSWPQVHRSTAVKQPAYAGLTKEGMLEGLSAPLHPGALKYYKEAGLMP